MSCARRSAQERRAIAVIAAVLIVMTTVRSGSAVADQPAARVVVQHADRQRGLATAYSFRARISSRASDLASEPSEGAGEAAAMLVEVWSNGFAQQLVLVLEPTRGDTMLVTPDIVWLRPRRLHRLTRIPPDLRLFNGASVSDVTSVDVLGSYDATLRSGALEGEYIVDLVANKQGVRYPRAAYRIRKQDFRPLSIDFMAASGKPLKSIRYEDFETILGRTIPTRLIVEDHVYRDSATVVLSDFQTLSHVDPAMFTPDYLLSLTDGTS
jgi:hypothetical protein